MTRHDSPAGLEALGISRRSPMINNQLTQANQQNGEQQ
jgi:hypothetical protein